GQAATIEIGAVSQGQTPSVTNSGTATHAVLDFVLPKGQDGAPGGGGWSGQPKNRYLAILGASDAAMCSGASGTETTGYLSHALRECRQRYRFRLKDNYGIGGQT